MPVPPADAPHPAATHAHHPGRRVALFIAAFALLMTAFYALTATAFYQQTVFPGVKSATAHASALVLRLLRQPVTVSHDTITAPTLALSIERGCDATEPIALVASALIAAAWPRPRRLLLALLIAVGALALLNVARVVSLYFARLHLSADAFATAHEAWQGAFAIGAVVAWITAARWALRTPPNRPPDGRVP